MIPQDQKKIIVEEGIEDFSSQYLNQIEKKESYDIKDIKEAFKAGAKWMNDFSVMANNVFERLS